MKVLPVREAELSRGSLLVSGTVLLVGFDSCENGVASGSRVCPAPDRRLLMVASGREM